MLRRRRARVPRNRRIEVPQRQGQIDKIDSTDRAVVVADDDVAIRCWQARQHEAQSKQCLPRRVNAVSN
jgi:hypothetical protein